ncbi:hypothetical protein [Bacillus sp. UMB0893]|uniref:hypothetical protein n=1 Tax=Bacillus sp. UMB0893 TaxID=2066053 RepID=UPI000C7882E1|nr:hypothetical protein [Bacillus sp. UMB0893]PLR69100.1 hypothetical protein CYJ36_01170 [Bacillus sp. UMB0893]
MFINDAKALSDDQILKEFAELVKENGEVKINTADPVQLSDRCIKDFTYHRMTGRKLTRLLDRSDTEMYLEKENISVKNISGYMEFSFESGKKQNEQKVINQFISLVKQNKKITLYPSHPSSSPLVSDLMKKNSLDDISFGFLLEEYRDLIRKDIYLIERNGIRRYSI